MILQILGFFKNHIHGSSPSGHPKEDIALWRCLFFASSGTSWQSLERVGTYSSILVVPFVLLT